MSTHFFPGPLLLVEDNEDDVFFMKRALKMSGITESLDVATDGERAIQHLKAGLQQSTRPKLVFLDLKLPFRSGFEVLSWIREQPLLHDLEVVILTSSGEERDRDRAAELAVREYLVKPPTREMLLALWARRQQPAGNPGWTAAP